jgi:hypothetical protein
VYSQEKLNDTVIQYYNLDGKAFQLWENIDSVWHYNNFNKCLSENKLKLSCAKCASIYLDVVFSIDSSGKLSDYKVVNERMCGGRFTPELKICFLEFFLNFNFPAELRRIKFQVRLGNSLKC